MLHLPCSDLPHPSSGLSFLIYRMERLDSPFPKDFSHPVALVPKPRRAKQK